MTIVVGYIPSPEGEAALDKSVSEAQRSGSRLIVVNSSKGDQPVDDRLLDAREYHQLEERLSASGIDFWIERSAQGSDAAENIVNAALAHEAELVVIGLRKRSAIGKFIMGNTAQRVILQAPCPVLSVKVPSDW